MSIVCCHICNPLPKVKSQDNSEIQSQLLLKIVPNGRVTVVGDDDQCIYEFRGAFPGNFDSFRTQLPSAKARLLEENYRSSGNILRRRWRSLS